MVVQGIPKVAHVVVKRSKV